jgi:hypothetical protein
MRLSEELKLSGYFWLPSSPDKKLPGILSIIDGGDTTLEVVGNFDSDLTQFNDTSLPRIIGIVEKKGFVTLENGFYKSKQINVGGAIGKSIIIVNMVFAGIAYEEGEQPEFDSIRFSIEGLDDWIGISGIKVEPNYESRSAVISYEPPEEVILNLNDDFELKIMFAWTLPGFPSDREAKITQQVYFKLISNTPRGFEEYSSVMYKLTTFLCFATDKIVGLKEVIGFSDKHTRKVSDDKTIPIQISAYYSSLPHSEAEPKLDKHRMLFRYPMIQLKAESIINKWIEAYDQIEPAFNLYFSTQTGAYQYLEGQFLALAQGLETYHRRTSDETMMDANMFAELVNSIVSTCPSGHEDWLKGRLKHGNEINLRKRINAIIHPFKDVLGSSKDRKVVINKIVDTRNYLTHFDKSLETKAASGKELWDLCSKMEVFFQLHFLQLLGFSTDEIESVLNNCFHMKQKIKQI